MSKELLIPQLAAFGAAPFWSPLLLLSYPREAGQSITDLPVRQIYRGCLPIFLGQLGYGPIAAGTDRLAAVIPLPKLEANVLAASAMGVASAPYYTWLRNASISFQQGIPFAPQTLTGLVAFAGRNFLFAPLLLVAPKELEPKLGLLAFPTAAAVATVVTAAADNLVTRKIWYERNGRKAPSYLTIAKEFANPSTGPFRGVTLRFAATTIEFYLFNLFRDILAKKFQ